MAKDLEEQDELDTTEDEESADVVDAEEAEESADEAEERTSADEIEASGSDSDSDEEADAQGADDALPLPFDRGLLVARVGNLLRCREQSRTIEKLRRRLDARIEDQLGELVRRGQLRQHLPQALLDGALHQVDDADEEQFDRRWVTVVYVGLTGLSDVADRVDPRDLSVMINSAARELTAEAVAHGGVGDQFFGDTLLIMFGAAEASKPEEQGISAIRAAFAIRDRARAMAAHWHRYGLPRELDVRVGIDTGLGAVGVIGSELTRRFTVLGPVSHTAAYLHTLPSESGVLASLAAFAKFRRAVKAKLRGTQPVAALHRNLEIYEIEGLVDDD